MRQFPQVFNFQSQKQFSWDDLQGGFDRASIEHQGMSMDK